MMSMNRTSVALALVILDLSCSLGACWEHVSGKTTEGNKHWAGVWQVLKRKLRSDISTDPASPIPLNNATGHPRTKTLLCLGPVLGGPSYCPIHSQSYEPLLPLGQDPRELFAYT